MLCICLLTYSPDVDHPRAEYAKRTLRSALDNIKTTGGLSVHIADDGSPPEFIDELCKIAGGYKHVKTIGRTNAERGGYGKSYNLATQAIHTGAEYIMPIEDDWVLDGPLNVDPLIEALAGYADLDIRCIRLGYIGYTQALEGRLARSASGQCYLVFDPDSQEPHVFAGHPRIETREFERLIGPWPEGYDPGTTEFMVAHMAPSRFGVAWPLDLAGPTGGIFKHIGTVQAREDQR